MSAGCHSCKHRPAPGSDCPAACLACHRADMAGHRADSGGSVLDAKNEPMYRPEVCVEIEEQVKRTCEPDMMEALDPLPPLLPEGMVRFFRAWIAHKPRTRDFLADIIANPDQEYHVIGRRHGATPQAAHKLLRQAELRHGVRLRRGQPRTWKRWKDTAARV